MKCAESANMGIIDKFYKLKESKGWLNIYNSTIRIFNEEIIIQIVVSSLNSNNHSKY